MGVRRHPHRHRGGLWHQGMCRSSSSLQFLPRFPSSRFKSYAFAFAPHATQIHADRYKREIYGSLGLKSSSTPARDRDIKHIFTGDPASTRFHACERFDRCEYAPDYRVFENENGQEGHGAEMTNAESILDWEMAKQRSSKVVYINPVDMSAEKWAAYQEEIKASLERGDCVSSLVSSTASPYQYNLAAPSSTRDTDNTSIPRSYTARPFRTPLCSPRTTIICPYVQSCAHNPQHTGPDSRRPRLGRHQCYLRLVTRSVVARGSSYRGGYRGSVEQAG